MSARDAVSGQQVEGSREPPPIPASGAPRRALVRAMARAIFEAEEAASRLGRLRQVAK